MALFFLFVFFLNSTSMIVLCVYPWQDSPATVLRWLAVGEAVLGWDRRGQRRGSVSEERQRQM